uniref:Dual specificity protein phosphatase n=1 Tax=Marinomonas sp. (strain MWYL1) TaxID=400668 RepID=A6W323_MARMS
MIEVCHNLFVGNDTDAKKVLSLDGWFIVHACKEPYHRQALGYISHAAPKTDPEYLIAKRENRLILNLVDAPNPAYIPKEVMGAAVEAIATNIGSKKVLVHCNKGMSRSPTIAFLYLLKHSKVLDSADLANALNQFKFLYPPYQPAGGVAGFVEMYWRDYLVAPE